MNTVTTKAPSQATTSQATTIVTAEREFGLIDSGVALIIISIACVYLYRTFWHKRGSCPGCGSKDGKCHLKSNPEQATEMPINVDALLEKPPNERHQSH